MRQLTGSYSAICTNAGLTYGVGNDGVTGKGAELWNIPTPDGMDNAVDDLLAYQTGESCVQTSAYIEAVEEWGEVALVQMRDGPKPPRGVINYIPSYDYKVTEVIDATPYVDDLLGWEAKVETLKEGAVILAYGCALSSHVVVHGIVHKRAVITDESFKRPEVGDTIQPEKRTPKALTKDDFVYMARQAKALFGWDFATGDKKP
jgi:hypothetical protein